MTYAVIFSRTAEVQLKNLDRSVQERILAVLERIKTRPYDFVKKLSGYPYFRLRAGDYRLILDIQNKELVIIVIELGHRKSIYK
ncbi:MAG: type II toxin-antitoxin system RelE/ParE family toxin [Candidatus Aenigmarchaeota archaeon]|nr:type II toxin-antitoxin system RelE/ParE family toxin [Candidatus Aenigmarchaeota archaeon]MDI6722338.1 type II toxin-antitoxin system RelE/ParE family toxin [Candidatus Aenigmarchaeota archaeon]